MQMNQTPAPPQRRVEETRPCRMEVLADAMSAPAPSDRPIEQFLDRLEVTR